MFFKRMGICETSYEALIAPTETVIHILYRQDNDTAEYDSTLQDELYELNNRSIPSSLLLFKLSSNETFLMMAAKVAIASTNTVSSAVEMIDKFMHSGERETFVLYSTSKEEVGAYTDRTTTSILVTLAKYNSNSSRNYGVLPAQLYGAGTVRESLGELAPHGYSYLMSTMTRKHRICCALIGIVTALSILAIIISYFILPRTADELHSWVQYDTRGSTGPKYQLSVDATNASAWSDYAQDPSLWTLRIDDQAIIPIHLLDDKERHYQEWLQKRYTEMDQIRLNGSYLDESWLGSPAIDEVPTDELFHFSHCVLAVKRYVKARDTGRHVCGRDIDKEHVHHCLDALDWWAFPEGRRGEDIPNFNRTFWWRTKVCFD